MSDCPCQEFKKLEDEDIADVMQYLQYAGYVESNHNIVNLLMWRFYYPLWICKQEHYLCLIGKHQGQWFMYMPLCKEEYFEEAVICTRNYFKRANLPFVMSCFTEEQMKKVHKMFPMMEVIEDRDGFDYIYTKEQLKTLSGKKLQKKRNHLNAFYKEYANRYAYESMDAKNRQECLLFLQSWKLEEEDHMLVEEKKGIAEIFRLWDVLPCNGGVLRVDGEVKAFIVSSPLQKDVAQINVEKADVNIRGCYQAILREHILDCLDDYMYINREDDMGLERLRQAKMAYNPCYMIKKYRLQER